MARGCNPKTARLWTVAGKLLLQRLADKRCNRNTTLRGDPMEFEQHGVVQGDGGAPHAIMIARMTRPTPPARCLYFVCRPWAELLPGCG